VHFQNQVLQRRSEEHSCMFYIAAAAYDWGYLFSLHPQSATCFAQDTGKKPGAIHFKAPFGFQQANGFLEVVAIAKFFLN